MKIKKNSQKNKLFHRVFIGGHRKSGTTLLASLLDGHSQLFTLPAETFFFYKYFPLSEDKKRTKSQKKKRFLSVLGDYDKIIRNWIDLKTIPQYSFQGLRETALCHLRNSDWSAQTVHQAYTAAIFETLKMPSVADPKYGVEKSTSLEYYFPYLKKWYPTHRFIQIVRDPRDNYASIKSGWTKRYQHQFDSSERLLQSVMDRAVGGLKLATYYQRAFPKEYYVIRFEDLVMRPKTVMKKLSTFLDIPFENSLTMPTFMGQPWKGNNFEEQSFRKISTKNRNQWKKRITDEEAKILEFYFSESIKVFGYSPVFSEKACAEAAGRHYAWFNYAQPYSPKLEWR